MTDDFTLEFASFLLKSNALKFGAFTLASGKPSPYYIDLRMLPSFPSHFRLVIGALRQAVEKGVPSFDCLASIPTSGLVFGSALAYEMSRPFLYVRKESKGYGTSKLVEGHLASGAKVVIVDDVATTGLSVSKAVEAIRANGGVVEDVVAVVSRMEGAEEKLQGMGVNLTAVATIHEIVNSLHGAGLVDDSTLQSVMSQVGESGEYEGD
ncbi:orotate phosphoribosyltransferase [Nitrososphaera sp.]|uniref:orotate phosphoribosyltransferase n=1 Tax=Nitrososphaera sp. TaxID=1971748 RepID=UPI002ED8C400